MIVLLTKSRIQCQVAAFSTIRFPVRKTISRTTITTTSKVSELTERHNINNSFRKSLHSESIFGVTSSSRLHSSSISSSSSATKPFSKANDSSSASDDINNQEESDTVFALSTGANAGQATAVAVIRLTGPQSKAVLEKMLIKSKTPPPRYAGLRKLYNWNTGDVLDQAVVLYFPGPNSFTGEDIVELHCHGSRAVVTAVLDCLSTTIRLAEPGEFTQRAWKNGKLDVLQLEALADLLTADTNQQLQQAMKQLDGQLSAVYDSWRQTLIGALAHAEAVIDFGDDEVLVEEDDDDDMDQNDSVWGGVVDQVRALTQSMQMQLRDARRGELVRQGVQIAIVGPPNAGKSSLFNILANRDAAIVSAQAGTTRDVLEVTLNLGGVKCILQDTAGVRAQTDDVIEREGMKRAVQAAIQADLVVAMVDSSSSDNTQAGLEILEKVTEASKQQQQIDENDESIQLDDFHQLLDPNNTMLVLNKADLNQQEKEQNTKATSNSSKTLDAIEGRHYISCVTQQGIDAFLQDLTNRVVARIGGGGGGENDNTNEHSILSEGTMITRARHRQHVQAAVEALLRFDAFSKSGGDGMATVDLAAEELRLAASELGRITGAVDVEDVLDKLFADFCIGK